MQTQGARAEELPATTVMPATTVILTQSWQNIEKTLDDAPLVVVDLWSLSCAPCLREFPQLVSLQREHGDAVRCISVSVDYDGRRRRPPETYLERVTDFVTSVDGGSLTNYLCNTPSDDVLEAVDAESIPTVLIYQNGKVVHKFVDAGATAGFTYEKDVAPAVAAMLK